jgi:hypothetical protein
MHQVLMTTLSVSTPPVVPDENGEYPVPAPGVYRPFA